MSHDALSQVSFEELLQRARAGDASAFNELFRRSRPTLDKWASRRRTWLPPGDDRPSDISQDISVRVLRGFPAFKGNTAGEWFSWLKEVFRNHLAQAHRDAHRQKRETPGVVSLDSEEVAEAPSRDRSPSQLTAHQEEWRRLFVCIYQLPEDQGEAIKLYHLKELPVAEIARRMGKTESSVSGLLHRGWKQVRAWMREAPDPDAGGGRSTSGEAAAAFTTFLRRRDAGEKVDPDTFIREHPACADELRDMLHWMERLQNHRPVSPTK